MRSGVVGGGSGRVVGGVGGRQHRSLARLRCVLVLLHCSGHRLLVLVLLLLVLLSLLLLLLLVLLLLLLLVVQQLLALRLCLQLALCRLYLRL